MLNSRFSSSAQYFGHLRMGLLNLADLPARKVLEIGCGHGQSLVYMRRERGAELVVGVELVPEVASIARSHQEIDNVLTGDIEQLTLPYEKSTFDLVIAG